MRITKQWNASNSVLGWSNGVYFDMYYGTDKYTIWFRFNDGKIDLKLNDALIKRFE